MAPETLAVLALLLMVVVGSVWMVRRRHPNSSSGCWPSQTKTRCVDTGCTGGKCSGQPRHGRQPRGRHFEERPTHNRNRRIKDAAAKTNTDTTQPKEVTTPPAQVLNVRRLRLRRPQTAKKEEPTSKRGSAAGSVPGALPGAASNNVGPLVKDISANVPKLAGQKLRVSSGVAQGQLLRQVTPQYPPQARQQRVEGTVVLTGRYQQGWKRSEIDVVSGPSTLTKRLWKR